MTQLETDVLVAGAGIVGVSTAVALAERGIATLLVDRAGVATGTSFGNAGLIQCESVVPYSFPRAPIKIVRYALNLAPEAHLHYAALPELIPWLWSYWRQGTPHGVRKTAYAMRPIVQAAAEAHRTMAGASGVSSMLRPLGYLKVYQTQQALDREAAKDEAARREFGVVYEAKSPQETTALEPHLSGAVAGAILHPQPPSVADPAALVMAYARRFQARGGQILDADAFALERHAGLWRLSTPSLELSARRVVLALGPWTNDVLGRFASPLPLGVKRGYHMHYAPVSGKPLGRPVMFPEHGFLITPMARGIRLTTGAEFARRDAPATPVQIERSEATARRIFPLGARQDETPWLGVRPCFPDLRPAIGPVNGVPGLWLNTGHHHLGLTLGPVTAEILADMMTGKVPFADPTPFDPNRF